MTKYVFKNGSYVDSSSGEPMVTDAHKIRFEKMLAERKAPLINSDLPDYLSPVTGKLVSGRVARREDLKRNDCYEIDPPSKSLRERRGKAESNIDLGNTSELNSELSSIAERGGFK